MGSTGSRDRFIGRTVGQYRLIEKIGSGGMGTVYKGTHVEIPGLVVAVKLLKLNLVDDGSLRQRFRDEAAIIAQLGERSPNVVQIRDYGIFEEFDAPYYMMEFLKGHSLDSLSCSGQPIPLKRLIPLACQLCNGLHVAHTQGVIHRDLKPANIFLIPDPQLGERIKILDFGIAKLVSEAAATGETVGYVGTPRYSSPEQFLGLQLNQRSDLFSLGVILYELFSNTQIHKADDESFASWYHIHTRMPPPQRVPSRDPNHPMPPEAEEIVLRCLAKDPQERPSSALDVEKHLQLALKNLIYQADQQLLSDAARLADIRDWRSAVACMEAITYDSPFYVEAQIALRTWRLEAASQQAIEQAEQRAEDEDDAAGGRAATVVAGTAIKAANPTRESSAGPQSTGPTLDTPHRPDVPAATQTTQRRARKSPQSTSTQPTRTAPWIFVAAGVAALVFGGGIMTLFAPKTPTTQREVKTDGPQKAVSPPVKQIFKQPQTGTRSGTEQSQRKSVRQSTVRKAGEAVRVKKDQKVRKQTVKADRRRLTVAKRLSTRAARRTRPGQRRTGDGPAISVSLNCYNPAIKASNYRCRNRKN